MKQRHSAEQIVAKLRQAEVELGKGLKVAIQTFTITETGNGQNQVYRSTTKAWSDDELVSLLTEAGFTTALQCEAWPSNTDAMRLWIARKD